MKLSILFIVLAFACDAQIPVVSTLSRGQVSDPIWYLSGGIPESLDYTVYDPYNADSQSESYVNLANPGTRDANPVDAPTWATDVGWTFNGTSDYLDSGIKPSSTSTVIIVVQSLTVNTGYAYGVLDGSGNRHGVRPNVTAQIRNEFGGGATANGMNISGGIIAINSAGYYLNGYKETHAQSWSGGATTRNIFIGCINQGSAATFYAGKILFFAHYNIVLSDAQIQSVTNAIFNQLTAVENSYRNTVLSSNPVYYFTMNSKSGITFFKEYTGKTGGFGNTVTGNTTTSGNSGLYGNAFLFPGTLTDLIRPSRGLSAELNLDEFSFACWVYFDSYPTGGDAVRMANCYSQGTSEYFVVEVRNNGTFSIFQREQGNNYNSTDLAAVPLDQWIHFVQYNSKSQNKRGVYVNGTKYEINRSGMPGFTDGVVTNFYPECFSFLNGMAQHVSFYDHALEQAEVDSLIP